MTKIFNRSSELEKRRALRASPTEAEKQIWYKLRKRNINGYKFRRQYSIGPYIADFFCPQAKLAVEIDGNVHNSTDAQEYDKVRDEFMQSIGIQILRFTNSEVENNPEKIVEEIIKAINP
jgi:very-short-patch-repair endonuclease